MAKGNGPGDSVLPPEVERKFESWEDRQILHPVDVEKNEGQYWWQRIRRIISIPHRPEYGRSGH